MSEDRRLAFARVSAAAETLRALCDAPKETKAWATEYGRAVQELHQAITAAPPTGRYFMAALEAAAQQRIGGGSSGD